MRSTMQWAAPILVLASVLLRLEAGEASVSARDGRQWRGQARFDTNAVVVASVERSTIVRVPLTNLASLRFTAKPASPYEPRFNTTTPSQAHWEQADVGFCRVPGHSRMEGGPVWMATGGTNIAASSDAFRFVYAPMKGNGEIVARLAQLRPAGPEARAGVMLRESTAHGSRNVFFGLARRGGVFQWRSEQDQLMQGRDSMFRSRWLRLRREGDQFLGYVSRNGRQWELIERATVPMGEDILAGLALTGTGAGAAAMREPAWRCSECEFDSVQMGPALRFHSFTPRILLQSGSSVSGDIHHATDREIWYAGPDGLEKMRVGIISRIDFYWVPYRQESRLRRGQPGVLLASGEFIEGELRGLSAGQCTLSSVLFGLRRFDVNSEVVSIVAGPPPRPSNPAAFNLSTWSGASWLATEVRTEPAGILLRDRAAGPVHVPYHDVKELARLPSRRP